MAEYYLRLGDWGRVKEAVLAANALQCRSRNSAVRLERELRQRLRHLTEEQVALLAYTTSHGRALLAWLAAVKQSSFLFEFAAETLRPKLEVHDTVLRLSDYARFVEERSLIHAELAGLTGKSSEKVRRVTMLMLREAGLLVDGEDFGTLQRPVIPPSVADAVRADQPGWLAAFLVPQHEIFHGS